VPCRGREVPPPVVPGTFRRRNGSYLAAGDSFGSSGPIGRARARPPRVATDFPGPAAPAGLRSRPSPPVGGCGWAGALRSLRSLRLPSGKGRAAGEQGGKCVGECVAECVGAYVAERCTSDPAPAWDGRAVMAGQQGFWWQGRSPFHTTSPRGRDRRLLRDRKAARRVRPWVITGPPLHRINRTSGAVSTPPGEAPPPRASRAAR